MLKQFNRNWCWFVCKRFTCQCITKQGRKYYSESACDEACALAVCSTCCCCIGVISSVKSQLFYDLLSQGYLITLQSHTLPLYAHTMAPLTYKTVLTHTQVLNHVCICDRNITWVCVFLSSKGHWKRKKRAPGLRRDFLIFLRRPNLLSAPKHTLPHMHHEREPKRETQGFVSGPLIFSVLCS